MKICGTCGELALHPGMRCAACGAKFPDGTIAPEGIELRDEGFDHAGTGNTRTPPRQASDDC